MNTLSQTGLIFGPGYLTFEGATAGTKCVGAIGSGKTLLMMMLGQSVLPELKIRHSRALWYDAKADSVSMLNAMGVDYAILNAFDRRGWIWDIALDLVSPTHAREFALILVPERRAGSSESFFDDVTRDLVAGVIIVFLSSNRHWTLRDVLNALLGDPRVLTDILMRVPMTRRLLRYLPGYADVRTAANIQSSLNARLGIYEPIAAAWDAILREDPNRRFSIRYWLENRAYPADQMLPPPPCRLPEIVVLGNDESARNAFDTINRIFFKRLSQILLSGRKLTRDEIENGSNFTWFFLDELREAGQLDGIGRLFTKGRSHGAAIVIGFQDVPGLEEAYGKETAHEVLGMCSSTAILRLNSPTTAEWGSQLFGDTEQLEPGSNISLSTQGPSVGTSHHIANRRRFLPSEFTHLPPTSPATGLHGMFWINGQGQANPPAPNRVQLDWSQDILPFLPPTGNDDDNYHPRPVTDQYLRPWQEEDYLRLDLTRPEDRQDIDSQDWQVPRQSDSSGDSPFLPNSF